MPEKTRTYLVKFGVLTLLTLPCAWIYFRYVWVWYLNKLGHVELNDTSTSLFLVGLMLHLSVIVPPHKEGELVFFGQPTGVRIENGFWFIPNLLHILITLMNWAVLFRVVDIHEETEEAGFLETMQSRWGVMHFHLDTRDFHHLVHSNAGLLAAGMLRLGQGLIALAKSAIVATWTFFAVYQKGAKFETASRLGFRVMLIAAAMAWWSNNAALYVQPIEFQFTIPAIEKTITF